MAERIGKVVAAISVIALILSALLHHFSDSHMAALALTAGFSWALHSELKKYSRTKSYWPILAAMFTIHSVFWIAVLEQYSPPTRYVTVIGLAEGMILFVIAKCALHHDVTE